MSIFINGIDRTPVNSLVLLNAAAGNEVANRVDYTVNKVAGDSTGWLINLTPTSVPGTNYILALQTSGTDVFSIRRKGELVGTTTLNVATGNEAAWTLNYTTNKLTSGNDTGFVINHIDTQSPGTSLLQDWQVGGVSMFKVDNSGAITSEGQSHFKSYLYSDARLYPSSATTYGWIGALVDNGMMIFVSATTEYGNRNLIISDHDNSGKDHDHDTLSPNPTLFINSATDPDTDNTQWISISHNQTNANVNIGKGALLVTPPIKILSSGTEYGIKITSVYNQTSGTAANTDLLINRTQTAVGSGAQLLIDTQIDSISWYKFATGNTATTGGFNASSGIEYGVTLSPIINQSGTAGWVGLYVNPTLTAVGSGVKISTQFAKGVVAFTPNDNTATPVAPTNPLNTFFYNASKADDAVITCPTITTSAYGVVILGTAEEYARFIVDNDGDVTLLDNSANVVANADTDGKLCIGTAATQEPLQIKNRLGGTKVLNVMMWYD